ncbi:MAG: ABC transporter permease [Bradyrhizobiaceae bacterium]|nr:ABC transporter permease [Bradyrhizobiaceae bacterium]
MRREGSPWQGLGVVFRKEFNDHLRSPRMIVLELLVVLIPIAALFAALRALADNASDLATVSQIQQPMLYLRSLTVAREPLLSFVAFLGFLVPLMGIGLAFDSVNGEHSRRTLSRILAQPIYRDALLFGKFLAGLATLAVCLTALWLMVTGLTIWKLGFPPSAEEIARSLVFLIITIFYAGVWLALAMLFSIVFRSAATAALAALGTWLFLALLWPALVPAIAIAIAPADPQSAALGLGNPAVVEWQDALARLSPNTLYKEAFVPLLNPSMQIPSLLDISQLLELRSAVRGALLPLGQSLMLIWPQAVSLIGSTIVLFAAGYVLFQRQEVRA